jgi:2-polyprenyl-3-methyl-5-hydroxy-6-metoxy-1,4-benzoquinol methylase
MQKDSGPKQLKLFHLMADNWVDFWKEKNAFDDSMGVNYSVFLEKAEAYVHPAKDSVVLDIGSGPGHLEDAWQGRVKEIHAVDVSKRYNDVVREKHRDHPHVVVHDLSETNYLDFSFLGNKKFDIIIVMSVLQYYKNKEEVKKLLMAAKQLAAPGGTMLIADIMAPTSFVKEVVQVLTDALKKGKFFSYLSLFVRLRFSPYYKTRKQAGFLVLEKDDWETMIRELGLNARFTEQPLTLQKNRKNLLVKF